MVLDNSKRDGPEPNQNRILMEEAVSQILVQMLGNSAFEQSAYTLEAIADRVVQSVLSLASPDQ